VLSRAYLDAAGKRKICARTGKRKIITGNGSAVHNESLPRVIPSFRREEAENCALLGCYVITTARSVITQKSVILSCYHV